MSDEPTTEAEKSTEAGTSAGPDAPRPEVLPREIRTARLVLRAVTPDDAQAQTDAVNASVPELSSWMPWCKGPQDVARSLENLTTSAKAFDEAEGFEYALWLGEEFAGRIGVHAYDARVPKGEIGYWTATPFAGRGLMKEAVAALTDAMLAGGFHRIEVRCDELNEASAAVARACGYQQDARFVNDDVSTTDPSVLRNTLVFSRTA